MGRAMSGETLTLDVKSRKLRRVVRFVARPSGYVFVDPNGVTWGRQIFRPDGNAEVAETEDQLRRVARRWIASVEMPYEPVCARCRVGLEPGEWEWEDCTQPRLCVSCVGWMHLICKDCHHRLYGRDEF